MDKFMWLSHKATRIRRACSRCPSNIARTRSIRTATSEESKRFGSTLEMRKQVSASIPKAGSAKLFADREVRFSAVTKIPTCRYTQLQAAPSLFLFKSLS